ncbi:MAG: ribonuclease III, partial [Clostridia bacterium]|nr:ribonuclease III [Clostridia bacterium]
MIFDIYGCEEKIGYSFKNKMLLRQCFTHSSYANEHGEQDNELLEFFGDSILEFVVTEYLFKNTKGDEGRLTKERAEMVSKTPLLKSVLSLGLDKFVLLSRGLAENNKLEEKLYSSIYEALVAGIYLDGGLLAVKNFISRTLIADYEKNKNKKSQKKKPTEDFKSKLQEYVQKKKLGSIRYELLWKKGPDHMPKFRVAVLLNGARIAEGEGESKKGAEMA